MKKQINKEDIQYHLMWKGFKSIGEWALDAGYDYDKDTDTWTNDDGVGVDIEEEIEKMLQEQVDNYE